MSGIRSSSHDAQWLEMFLRTRQALEFSHDQDPFETWALNYQTHFSGKRNRLDLA